LNDAPRSERRERLEARVTGYVQGVGFRWFAVRNATRLGLTGWTANQSDGSVRIVAEGPSVKLDKLAVLLRRGPAGASVENVDEVRMPATGEFGSFGIRSGGHRGD
jgi:acylphosphatase